MKDSAKKIGMIAGGGFLPLAIAEACEQDGTPLVVLAFDNQPQPETIMINRTFALGAVTKVVNFLKTEGVTHVVMAGFLNKPSLFDLRLDTKAIALLRQLTRKHDNDLLQAIENMFKAEGFMVLGAHEIAPSLLAKEGHIAGPKLAENLEDDVALGLTTVQTLGRLDIGQCCVVKDGVVLGVEAVEGTNQLLERCAGLRGKKGKGGVLVKCAKPDQTLKVDMPTIGPNTVELMGEQGFDAIVVEAGRTLILDDREVARLAKKYKLSILGIAL